MIELTGKKNDSKQLLMYCQEKVKKIKTTLNHESVDLCNTVYFLKKSEKSWKYIFRRIQIRKELREKESRLNNISVELGSYGKLDTFLSEILNLTTHIEENFSSLSLKQAIVLDENSYLELKKLYQNYTLKLKSLTYMKIDELLECSYVLELKLKEILDFLEDTLIKRNQIILSGKVLENVDSEHHLSFITLLWSMAKKDATYNEYSENIANYLEYLKIYEQMKCRHKLIKQMMKEEIKKIDASGKNTFVLQLILRQKKEN